MKEIALIQATELSTSKKTIVIGTGVIFTSVEPMITMTLMLVLCAVLATAEPVVTVDASTITMEEQISYQELRAVRTMETLACVEPMMTVT